MASQAAAIFWELAGAIELMSMITEPSDVPSRTPFSPRMAASESAESGTIVMTIGAEAATSAEDEAGFAPSVTISSMAEPTTSKTVSEYPAVMRFLTMGRPMIPRPMNPISPPDMMCLLNEGFQLSEGFRPVLKVSLRLDLGQVWG